MDMRKDTYKKTGTDEWTTIVKVDLDIADKTADEVLVMMQQGIAAMHAEYVFGARLEVDAEGYNVEHRLVGQRSATTDEIASAKRLTADSLARRAERLRAELAEIEKLENGS